MGVPSESRTPTRNLAVTMLKNVDPYHAAGDHRRAAVYHDRADCPIGRLIHSDHLAAGTGGNPLCEQCRALGEQQPESPGKETW